LTLLQYNKITFLSKLMKDVKWVFFVSLIMTITILLYVSMYNHYHLRKIHGTRETDLSCIKHIQIQSAHNRSY
jgi:hypothetical protein